MRRSSYDQHGDAIKGTTGQSPRAVTQLEQPVESSVAWSLPHCAALESIEARVSLPRTEVGEHADHDAGHDHHGDGGA